MKQVKVIQNVLDKFCDYSRLKVSLSKSLLHLSANVPRQKVKEISDGLGIKLTNDLGKYLGMPSKFLLDKELLIILLSFCWIRFKASWHINNLSMAGKITLVKSVTTVIPRYAMQTTEFPKALCDSIDKYNRDFLWGNAN